MNILGWHLSLRRKHSDAPTAFGAVLPRVRAMREHCDWPPTTTPSTLEQRRERVQDARRRIVYRPEPYDIAPEPAPRRHDQVELEMYRLPAWMRLLGYVVPFGLLAGALAWVMLANEWGHRMPPRSFYYPLPSAPAFLTEKLALAKAKESLAQVVRDPNDWQPAEIHQEKIRTAPDGTRDVYLYRFTPTNPNAGGIAFTSPQHPGKSMVVNMDLRGAQLTCTVSESK